MSNCPKCGEKLSPLYFKQTCPKCNANLLYYDLEQRLDEDAASAKAEWDAVDRLKNGIVASGFGSVPAIARTVSYFASVILLLVPVYKVSGLPVESISLLSIIKMLVGGQLQISDALSDTPLLLSVIAFVAVVLAGLVSLVLSLLSFTKNGLKRNIALTIVDIVLFIALSVATIITGGKLSIGVPLIAASMLITLLLHKPVSKKINN